MWLSYGTLVMWCLGYEVQKLPVKGHGDWTPVNTKPISGTTFTVPNLIEGSEFEFRVVAINDAGPGKPSKSTGPHKVRDPICEFFHVHRRIILSFVSTFLDYSVRCFSIDNLYFTKQTLVDKN